MDGGKFDPFARRRTSQEGDFDQIYADFSHKVYALALRMTGNREDALDTLQETFLRIYRNVSCFRGESSISTWVYSIAANVCRDLLKKRKSNLVVLTGELEIDCPRPDFTKNIEDREFLAKTLLYLPEELRICLVLSDLFDLSYDQIATTLSIPEGTVKSRIFRARKKLLEILGTKSASGESK